jgi:hypothetical protein
MRWVPSSECRVVGCDTVYSTVHECRARTCSVHCAALYVTLDTNKEVGLSLPVGVRIGYTNHTARHQLVFFYHTSY